MPGQSIAYFGPDVRVPVPQPALNVNMDAHTNVESLSFSLDGLAKKIARGHDPRSGHRQDPDPDSGAEHQRRSGRRWARGSRRRRRWSSRTDMAKLKPTEAARADHRRSASSLPQAISGSGSLDVLRYGRVLRSRMLVGVRGAGLAYDGLYYVDSVTHNIKRGEYKQSFTLSRDGLISITPRVVP